MEISIQEIEKSIKNVFVDADVLNTKSVYEHIDDSENLKLIIFINKLLDKDTCLLYTKIIFVVDENKQKITNNSFMYLYDINCKYVTVEFNTIDEFEKKLKNIISKKKFGKDIITLSNFIEKPSFLINEWMMKNKIDNINISNIKYDPKMYIMPCKLLNFTFEIYVNNIIVEFSLRKENSQDYIYSFKINNNITTIMKPNLNTLIPTIAEVLKKEL